MPEFQLIISVRRDALHADKAPFAALGALCDDKEVSAVEYLSDECMKNSTANRPQDSRVVDDLESQLRAFLRDPRPANFRLPLRPAPTDFQKNFRKAVRAIPFGETRTCGQIAASIGNPRAAQAVGNACVNNRLCVIVPCYRVVGKNDIGGFDGNPHIRGIDPVAVKRWLLKREGHF